MAQTEMLTIKRGYDFSKWLLQHTGKFPRSHRFSVAVKLENAMLDFIEHTSVANTRQNKLPIYCPGVRLDEARRRLRARAVHI